MAKPKRKGTMGRKGKPLNTKKDFDEPVKKEPKQENLIEIPPEPARSPVVQHGKMSAHFVRFVADRSKDRNPVVFLDFSLELEDVHEGRLPHEIEDEWKHFKRGSVKRTDPSGMGPQNLELSSVSDSEPDLAVVAAMSRAVISRITQKGKGKERKVIRLQMSFLTAYTADVDRFCRNNFDETVWLAMKESQMSLGESDAEAAAF
jgi:hypothetical protein